MGAMKPTLDSLQLLSPNSRDAALGSLQRKALQELAKEAGLRANAKSIEIVESLSELLQQRTSDTGGTGETAASTDHKAAPSTVANQKATTEQRAEGEAAAGPDPTQGVAGADAPASTQSALVQPLPCDPALSELQVEAAPLGSPDSLRTEPTNAAAAPCSPGGTLPAGPSADAPAVDPLEKPAAAEGKAIQQEAAASDQAVSAPIGAVAAAAGEACQPATAAAMMWSSISNPMFDEAKAPAQDAGKRREPSPEELSDLDRAVAQAQASQGDLSPSLLTIVPARPSSVTGMESPMQRAFERGRKSGLWQGSTEVALRQLERQWDSYKDTSNRKWSLPRLEDVQAKSDALADSGFTTVDSPNIRTSTKQGLNLAPSSGTKRKAREEDTEGQEQRPSAPKSAKQHRGQAPSHRQPRAACFSPLRPKNTPVFRPTATPERCTLMTKPDAACRDTPRPLGLPPRPDTTPGKGLKAAAPVDRARKAEAAFAARRAAAMAKGKSGK